MDEVDIRAFLSGDYRRLVGALTVVAGSRAAAEDAVQEALARAWTRGLRGQVLDSPSVWIAVVARNVLRSAFRRMFAERAVRLRLEQELDAAAATGLEIEGHLDVIRAAAALPGRQREAVALHYFAGLSLAEVGRVIGTTEGAVKALLHRARGTLALKLRDTDDLSSEEVEGVAGR